MPSALPERTVGSGQRDARQLEEGPPDDLVGQEFFVKGTANIYDCDSSGNVVTRYRDVPYQMCIVVYRPADPGRFSGTVPTEILNMSNNYDFPVIWAASHDQIMTDGDLYVGVTCSPNAIAALQKFNPRRSAWHLEEEGSDQG